MLNFYIMRRKFLRGIFYPLELFIRLQAKFFRFILNNAQLTAVQQLGAGFSCGVGLSIQNHGIIKIGNDFCGANFLQLSAYNKGYLKIGERCFFGDYCKIIAGDANIQIGDNCLVAEQVSIRASNHGTKVGCLINKQSNIYKDITIGSDVWIGKGVTILAGSIIPDGVVIGANSVVPGNFYFESYSIYAGNPVRKISLRN